MKRVTTLVLIVLLLTLAISGTVLAGSASGGGDPGITLNYPDNMVTCTPTFHISTTGVPDSFTVNYDIFIEVSPGELLRIGNGTSNGNLDINFTPQALNPGTTNTYAVFIAVFNGQGVLKEKLNGKWTVTCVEEPPNGGGQGCTPGYWRQSQHFDSWAMTPYAPSDIYNAVFGVSGSYETLLNAVWARGGGEGALARHAVAALLNAAHPDVSYYYTQTQVIQMVQDAYASGNFESVKNMFEEQNEAGCPLN